MTVSRARPLAATPRTVAQRKADVLDRLAAEHHVWIASANEDSDAHLVPLAFVWDGTRLWMATHERNRTLRNLRRTGRARAALASTQDVVIIEGTVSFAPPTDIAPDFGTTFAKLPLDPRRVPGTICVQLTPRRILAWRSPAEMPDRTVMADGRWLD